MRILALVILLFCMVGCNKQDNTRPPPVRWVAPPVERPPEPPKVQPKEPEVKGVVVYKGTWVTTNRKLDGPMTCEAESLGNNRWKGRFFGVWEGIRFSYNVEWSGTPDNLTGTATIDGADYQWKGSIEGDVFKATFTGNRYKGYFNLKRVQQ